MLLNLRECSTISCLEEIQFYISSLKENNQMTLLKFLPSLILRNSIIWALNTMFPSFKTSKEILHSILVLINQTLKLLTVCSLIFSSIQLIITQEQFVAQYLHLLRKLCLNSCLTYQVDFNKLHNLHQLQKVRLMMILKVSQLVKFGLTLLYSKKKWWIKTKLLLKAESNARSLICQEFII